MFFDIWQLAFVLTFKLYPFTIHTQSTLFYLIKDLLQGKSFFFFKPHCKFSFLLAVCQKQTTKIHILLIWGPCCLETGSLNYQQHQLKFRAYCFRTSQPTATGRGYNAHILPLHVSWEEETKNVACCSVLPVLWVHCDSLRVRNIYTGNFSVRCSRKPRLNWKTRFYEDQQTNPNYTLIPLLA